MKIDDYIDGTASIRLYKSQFKYEEDFEKICEFLKLPTACRRIDIEVCKESYKGI